MVNKKNELVGSSSQNNEHQLKVIDLNKIEWGPNDHHKLQHFFADSGEKYGLLITDNHDHQTVHSLSKKECEWLMSMDDYQAKEDQHFLKQLASHLPDYEVADLIPPVALNDTQQLQSIETPKTPLNVKTVGKEIKINNGLIYSDGDNFTVEVPGENGSMARFDQEVGKRNDWFFEFPSEGKDYFAIDPKQFASSFDVPVYARFDKQTNHVLYTTKRSLMEGCAAVLTANGEKVTTKSINKLATKAIQRSISTNQSIGHSLLKIKTMYHAYNPALDPRSVNSPKQFGEYIDAHRARGEYVFATVARDNNSQSDVLYFGATESKQKYQEGADPDAWITRYRTDNSQEWHQFVETATKADSFSDERDGNNKEFKQPSMMKKHQTHRSRMR